MGVTDATSADRPTGGGLTHGAGRGQQRATRRAGARSTVDGDGRGSVPAGLLREAAIVAAQRVLDEDLDVEGDATSAATIGPDEVGRSLIVAGQPGIVAGLAVVVAVFDLVDPRISVAPRVDDGAPIGAGGIIVEVAGPLRSLLTGRPTAVGLLGHLSGIATRTRAFVDAIDGTGGQIGATRRTTPGLRTLEHAAVRSGGGTSGRSGLFDGLLVGADHAAGAGSLAAATRWARASAGDRPVVVEVTSQRDVDDALQAGAPALRIVGADPRATADLVDHARRLRRDDRPLHVEVAVDATDGGVELVRTYAATGVDRVVLPGLVARAVPLDIEVRNVGPQPDGASLLTGATRAGASPAGTSPEPELLFNDRRGED